MGGAGKERASVVVSVDGVLWCWRSAMGMCVHIAYCLALYRDTWYWVSHCGVWSMAKMYVDVWLGVEIYK